MKITRRQCLRAGAALAGAASLAPWAQPAPASTPPRNLIVVLASGGWDTTYALDPKPGSARIDAPEGTLRRFGDSELLTAATRPSVTRFFEAHGSITQIVNGIQVRSFVHSDCVKRILTGTPSDANADLGALAAFAHGRDLPVPYLVLGNSALSGPLASITGRAGTTNQIATLLTAGSGYADPSGLTPEGFAPTATEEARVQAYLAAASERVRATRGRTGANARQMEAFVNSLERQGRLRKFASSRGFGEREYTPDLGVQVDVTVNALAGGLCHSVMLESGDWDTHQGNGAQDALWESLFAGLSTLVERLQRSKLLDRTVVVVLSEMGRTPKLNDGLGKDHWPITSALVLGAGVRGGVTTGATDDLLGARSLDLRTGAPTSGGKQLQTGNLVAGLLALVGVEPSAQFPDVEPLRALGA